MRKGGVNTSGGNEEKGGEEEEEEEEEGRRSIQHEPEGGKALQRDLSSDAN